jgi:hypothetical protein
MSKTPVCPRGLQVNKILPDMLQKIFILIL